MDNLPLTSVIMPVHNEAKFIAESLDSILAQDYPAECMEILVVDGASEDETMDIVTEYSRKDKRIRLLSNPARVTPAGLNVALRAARGAIIVRIDGHWYSPPDILKQAARLFRKYDLDCLGGRIVREVGTDTGCAIEFARNSLLGGGLSIRNNPSIKEHVTQGPNIAHIWRKAVFDKVGLFDERFVKNQDNEFNLRAIKAGSKTLYSPCILYHQHVPDSFRKLFHQIFAYASYAPMLNLKHKSFINIHLAGPAGILLVWLVFLIFGIAGFISITVPLVLLGVYILMISHGAFIAALKTKKFLWHPGVFAAYIVIHAASSLGYLRGMLRFLNLPLASSLWSYRQRK